VVFAARQSRPMDIALMGAAVGRTGGLLLASPGGAADAGKVLDQLRMRYRVDRLVMADGARAGSRR
jgi:hypothetical protein